MKKVGRKKVVSYDVVYFIFSTLIGGWSAIVLTDELGLNWEGQLVLIAIVAIVCTIAGIGIAIWQA
jgi:hypothetical protein